MSRRLPSCRTRTALLPALLVLVAVGGARAQPYDVPYVPTPEVVVETMLRVAEVGPDDFVLDLGSGDGRIPIAAALHLGARGLGVDIDPGRVRESLANARAAGVEGKVEFVNADLFGLDLRRASVVTMYLLPDINLRLRPKLLAELAPGTRVVSHDFDMGDWQPDRVVTVGKAVLLWIVPARVAGRWALQAELPVGGHRYELDLRQAFQRIDGTARSAHDNHALWEARLSGDLLRFVLIDQDMAHRFEGRVRGDVIEGVARSGLGSDETEVPFRAVRMPKP